MARLLKDTKFAPRARTILESAIAQLQAMEKCQAAVGGMTWIDILEQLDARAKQLPATPPTPPATSEN